MPLETFFPTTEQTNLFLLSILVGALLGVVYEIFRVIRITLPHNDIAVFFEDLLFSFIWGFSMLVFVIELGRGELRLFFVIGNIIGYAYVLKRVLLVYIIRDDYTGRCAYKKQQYN